MFDQQQRWNYFLNNWGWMQLRKASINLSKRIKSPWMFHCMKRHFGRSHSVTLLSVIGKKMMTGP